MRKVVATDTISGRMWSSLVTSCREEWMAQHGREIDDPVFGGRRFTRGTAGQLGFGTPHREDVHPDQPSSLWLDRQLDDRLRPVPVMRPDVLGAAYGHI